MKPIIIKNQSIENFANKYIIGKMKTDFHTTFSGQIFVTANSFEDGQIIILEVFEYGNRTYKDIITEIKFKVKKYDYLQDELVRICRELEKVTARD